MGESPPTATHRREIQRVANPETDPVRPRDDRREEQLRDVELEEQREERVGVDVEGVRPATRTRRREGAVSTHPRAVNRSNTMKLGRAGCRPCERGCRATHHSTFWSVACTCVACVRKRFESALFNKAPRQLLSRTGESSAWRTRAKSRWRARRQRSGGRRKSTRS